MIERITVLNERRKKAAIILSLIAVQFCAMSCSEDRPIVGVHSKARGLSVPFTFIEHPQAVNPDNPYDCVGMLHNRLVQYYAAYCEVYGWPDDASRINHIASVEMEYITENLSFLDADSLEIHLFPDYWSVDSLAARINDVVYNSEINDSTHKVIEYLDEEYPEVLDFVLDVWLVLINSTIVDKYESIRSLEGPVICDIDSLPEAILIRGLKLSISSVARHSHAYWSDTLSRPYWPTEIYPDGSKIYLTRGINNKDQGSANDKQQVAADIATTDLVNGITFAVAATGIVTAVGVAGVVASGGALAPAIGGIVWGAVKGGMIAGSISFAGTSMADAMAGGAQGASIRKALAVKSYRR